MTRARGRDRAVVGGLDVDAVRAGDVEEQGRPVARVDVLEERDACVDEMELEARVAREAVTGLERRDRRPIEAQEVARVALAHGVDALEAVQMAVHGGDELVDERVREASRSTVWNSRCTAANASGSSTQSCMRVEQRAQPAHVRGGDLRRLRFEQRRLDEKAQRVDLFARAERRRRDDGRPGSGWRRRGRLPRACSARCGAACGRRRATAISRPCASRCPGTYAPSTIRSRRRTYASWAVSPGRLTAPGAASAMRCARCAMSTP